ncbi:MAG: minor capsid protein [Treponema sp.]|nr:minor capsid protein [Treponema sp.]
MGEAAKLFTRSLLMGLDSSVRKEEFAEPSAEDIENMPYHEAVEYLKKRDVIKKADYNKLSDKMKFRAFTASRINDGKLLERLNAEMIANVNDGKGLKDFLSMTKTDILDKVGMGPNQGWYWETVYRTNVQTAYNAGRMMGFEEDKPLALHFVGIEDARQTDICHSMSNVIRPYDDPIWQKYIPPLHFGCRSTVRAIYDRDELPDEWTSLEGIERPAKGFGTNPVSSDSWWDELESQVRQAKHYGVQGEIEAAKSILINKSEPKESEFISSKDIKTANKYAEETLGITHADYKGCSIEAANEWNKGLYENFKKFPELKERFGFVGECHARNAAMKKKFTEMFYEQNRLDFEKLAKLQFPNASKDELKKIVDDSLESYAKKYWQKHYMNRLKISERTIAESYSPPAGWVKEFTGITVNKDKVKDFATFLESAKRSVEIKWSPVGTESLKASLDHEIGHQLDSMLDIRKDSVILKLWKSLSNEQITDGLSEYAWNNTNKEPIGEFIAEAWSEYCNNPKPRKISKTVGDRIMELYKQWKKK